MVTGLGNMIMSSHKVSEPFFRESSHKDIKVLNHSKLYEVKNMNMKSKIATLSTATVLILTLAGQSFAATYPFTDLTNVGAKEKILILQEKGYMQGIGDDLFAPNATITAAQGIQFIVNALKLNLDHVRFIKEPKATDYFSKADNDAWYANALIVASVNGLELPNDLDLSQEWTREEFTYRLIQAIETHKNLPMINLVPVAIADQDQLSASYDGAIQRGLFYGIIKLDAQDKFNPKGTITRAEAAEEIYNGLEYIKTHTAP